MVAIASGPWRNQCAAARQTLGAFLRNRTKTFRMKHFGTIDGLAKYTFAARDKVQSRDLAQAENCDRFKHFPRGF
jgi:hypothetical protein